MRPNLNNHEGAIEDLNNISKLKHYVMRNLVIEFAIYTNQNELKKRSKYGQSYFGELSPRMLKTSMAVLTEHTAELTGDGYYSILDIKTEDSTPEATKDLFTDPEKRDPVT